MKTIAAKYPGKCSVCDRAFERGATIAWDGRAAHPDCFDLEAANLRAEEERRDEEDRRWREERKRGDHLEIRLVGDELVIRNAWNYEQARDAAFACISSISAATGVPSFLVRRVRNGKKYLGRELGTWSPGGGIFYHDGWAFKLRAPAVAA